MVWLTLGLSLDSNPTLIIVFLCLPRKLPTKVHLRGRVPSDPISEFMNIGFRTLGIGLDHSIQTTAKLHEHGTGQNLV